MTLKLRALLTFVAVVAVFLAALTSATPRFAKICWAIVFLLVLFHLIRAFVLAATERTFPVGFVLSSLACLSIYHFDVQHQMVSPDDLIIAIHSRVQTTTKYYGGVPGASPSLPPRTQHPRYDELKALIDSGAPPPMSAWEWTDPQMPSFLYIGRAFAVILFGVAGGCLACRFLHNGRPLEEPKIDT